MAFLRKLVGSFSQELIRCVDSSLQRLSKEHKSVFAVLGWLSGVCGGSFDQSLAHALLGQEQSFSRAALHRLHGQTLLIVFAITTTTTKTTTTTTTTTIITTTTTIVTIIIMFNPCLQAKASST